VLLGLGLGLELGLDIVSGWLVVLHTYLYYILSVVSICSDLMQGCTSICQVSTGRDFNTRVLWMLILQTQTSCTHVVPTCYAQRVSV